jgi:hypothetical protein
MMKHRMLAKAFAGLLVAGTIALGAAAPAQASDTGWNGTSPPAKGGGAVVMQSSDTGWNGT